MKPWIRSVIGVILLALITTTKATLLPGGGVPVYDMGNFANLVKQIGLTTQQLAELTRIYQTSVNMVAQAQWIHHSVTRGLDPRGLAQTMFDQEFTNWITRNIPRDYHALMRAGAEGGQLFLYLKDHYQDFPLLTATQINPWQPRGSPQARHFMATQKSIGQSLAAAKAAYDQAARDVEMLLYLQRQNNQPTLAASAQLGNSIALAQALLVTRREQLRSLHDARAASEASEQIEGQRRWLEFLGPPVGSTRPRP
jgi:hypothetical protein